MNNEQRLFHQAESNFFSLVSMKQMDYGSLIAFKTGVQASGLNPAFVKHVDRHLYESLNECARYYEKNQLPWAVVLPDYLQTDHTRHDIQSLGFSCTGIGVAQAAVLDNIQFPSQSSPLQCRLMHNELDTWSIPLIYGFESTPEVTAVYTHRHQLALQKTESLYHFSGFVDETVVCSLTLSLCGSCARIDDVATMPAFQKQGFASGLIYEALRYAKKPHVGLCFLEASEKGLGLYKRIGFKELFSNYYYEKIPQNDS